MEYFNNILCVSYDDLVGGDNPIMSASAYKLYVYRSIESGNTMLRVREGKGANNYALLNFEMLRSDIRQKVISKYGDPRENTERFTIKGMIETDLKAVEYFATYRLADGRALPDAVQNEYVANASALNVIHKVVNDRMAMRKALGGSTRNVWEKITTVISGLAAEFGHNLPTNHRRLKSDVYAKYMTNGYVSLISGKWLNKNASKLVDSEQEAMIRSLLRKHQNLDNEQICSLYNIVADQLNWKTVTSSSIANYRKKWKLETFAGQKGVTAFDNIIGMQVKRSAPVCPLVYWTMDGWDAELLYQKTEIDKKGHSVTTYHNRLTVVIVLDPCKKYPIGYAIGTHETPALIKQALRNAITHTKELFGERHKVLQLQTDNYGKGTLTPFYEVASEKYTPARIKNAKSKVIEPYFSYLNKKYFSLMENWSGFGVASGSKRQPNSEMLNKIKSNFPTEQECAAQIAYVIDQERRLKVVDYVNAYNELHEADRLIMSNSDYLYYLGVSTGYTNKLTGNGIVAKIEGVKREFDTLDQRFRKHIHTDWELRYDPADLTQVLAVSNDGQLRFELFEKYVQPMALYDRKEGDAAKLAEVDNFNKQLKESIISTVAEDHQLVSGVFERNEQLEGTLTKLILTDSTGNHKNNRNSARLAGAQKLIAKQVRQAEREEVKSWKQEQESYLDSKVDVQKYI